MTYDATAGLGYTFDPENRITGANGYTYTYDGDGNRVKKSNSSTGTLYWYMTPGVVAESDLSGAINSEYVFFDGERVARKDFPSNAVAYYFSDHLKTASVITDSAGNIKAESDYYPWGGELQFVNNDSNHFKFGGHEHDNETGLEYYGARYYSNGLGRWVSADWSATPIPVPYADFGNPQSLNLYGYVGGNPASKADPDGHAGPDLEAAIIDFVTVTYGPRVLPAVESVANDIGNAASNFLDTAAHGFNAANANCSCNSQPAQSSPEEDSKQNNNNSKSENTNEQSSSKTQSNKGEPAQLKAGKEAHKSEAVRPGEKAEVRTPSGKRMDRYNKDAAHIREIKPDNARGEAAGQKQLDGYKKEMDQATGKDHTTELTKYPKKEP
jgi:RHS repeat-associated protein